MFLIKNRPFRVALLLQLLFAVAATVVCGLLAGLDGALSSFFGSLISVIGSGAYAIIVSRHSGYSVSSTLRTAFRAEAVKLFLIIILLWAVFSVYVNLELVMFMSSFIIAVLISNAAVFVSEKS
jgi:ATP synthase protein I